MLVPLKREKFEQLIPRVATGPQYKYYWGKFPDFLQRLLYSVVVVVVLLIVRGLLGNAGDTFYPILFGVGLIAAFYWLWGPVLWASVQNSKYRRYKYGGFFRGRVMNVSFPRKLVGKQETVNSKGELVVVENREQWIELEIGDDLVVIPFKAPLRAEHKVIVPGLLAELVVMSNRADLSRIEAVSDVYVPRHNLWVSDYPYVSREFFRDVSDRLRTPDRDRRSRSRRRREEEYDDYDDED